jgi:hypothetical protein
MATLATVVFRSFAIPSKPGKYISIEKGPSAVREPKIRINLKYVAFVIIVEGIFKFFANVKI